MTKVQTTTKGRRINPGKVTDISTPNNDLILSPNTEMQVELERKQKIEREEQERRQTHNESIKNPDLRFAERTFICDELIIGLFMKDYIRYEDGIKGDKIQVKIDNQIPVQTDTQQGYVMIDNPLPYMFKGVIQVVPEHVRKRFKENTGIELKPGMVVDLRPINLQDSRFYFDNDMFNHVINDEQIMGGVNPFPDFEGFFKVYAEDLISIINE